MLVQKQSHLPKLLYMTLATVICVTGVVFKIYFTLADAPELLGGMQKPQMGILGRFDLVTQARAVFLGVALLSTDLLLIGFRRNFSESRRETIGEGNTAAQLQSLHAVLTLFLMTQSRVTNIPLFALMEIQLQTLASMNLSSSEISLSSILLQYTSFFAFGGSNAISSIDLSNAYNGISGYSVVAVGILTFCSNWAGPMWWMFATMLLLARVPCNRENRFMTFYHFSTFFVANAAGFVMLACTMLRTHLFVWTVFSPKYLYTIAWALGQHICVFTVAIACFWWLKDS
ncbi:MAG: hypothetical protein Q9174_001318 [Haloplaca sp. 1 TL-2023]